MGRSARGRPSQPGGRELPDVRVAGRRGARVSGDIPPRRGFSMTPMKPRPSLVVLQWIDKHTGDAEAAVSDYQAFEEANVLGNRIGHAVWLTENVAGNLTRGT